MENYFYDPPHTCYSNIPPHKLEAATMYFSVWYMAVFWLVFPLVLRMVAVGSRAVLSICAVYQYLP